MTTTNAIDPKLKLNARNVALLTGIVFTGGTYAFLRANSEDIWRDLRFILKAFRTVRLLNALSRQEYFAPDYFREAVRRAPEKEALCYINDDDTLRSYTFKEVDELSNKCAQWAIKAGLKRGDRITLMLDNKPELIFFFLGMAKLGVITAFINTNLRSKPLLHSLKVSTANKFVIGIEHAKDVMELRKEYINDLVGEWFCYGGDCEGFVSIDPLINVQPSTTPSEAFPRGRHIKDVLCYIYTSGTTGLPKASIVKHQRIMIAGHGFTTAFQMESSDRIYSPLPLYHSSALIIGLGLSWHSSATFVFRRRFSASKYFEDCRRCNCTAGLYVGELCRYLLATPPSPADKMHKVRIVIGNGLRPDIWEQFQQRFNIPQIGEFYASTEGNLVLFNTVNERGAIGFVPPLGRWLQPYAILRYDVEKDELVRGPNGFCIPCKDDEPGELVALINDTDTSRDFGGYTDPIASEKKIARDVFVKGDRYFRSGDLVKRNKRGYFYFVDRIGDTFRWKGENVSTSEVEEVLNRVPGVKESCVYGVKVPGCEGRAGMALLVLSDNVPFNLDTLYERVMKELPPYAAPLFLRVSPQIEMTNTFKYKKVNLAKESFDPNIVKDQLYFRDDGLKKFVPLDSTLFQKICTQNLSAKM
jgi:fatty-acyl-CoA synthase